jgi:hypothetical protein
MYKPKEISTDERIFKIRDTDDLIFLCNLKDLTLGDIEQIKRVYHLWDFKWKVMSKSYLKEMLKIRDINKLEGMLKSHMWNYEFTSFHSHFVAGVKSLKEIQAMEEVVGKEVYKNLYNKYAPERFKI